MANEVLTFISKSGGLKHFLVKMLLLACAIGAIDASAQVRNISGTVTDEAGEPMIGVSVIIKGSSNGIATDIDGHYRLKASAQSILEFSYIGYETRTVTVGDRNVIDIVLKEDVKTLDEVVVVAYGTQKKSSITGAISQVGSEDLQKRPVSSVTAALEGSTSGITVTGNYGAAGESPSIRIRGVGTVNGSLNPLYVIDGVPFDGNITDLNPEDIESLSVLKDAASAALYGNRAANGVILITTKKSKSERVQLTFKTNQGWYQRGIPEYDVTNADQWMTSMFNAVRNFQYGKNISNGLSHADALSSATQYAQNNTINDIVKLNIYDVAAGSLFMADGSLNPSASILSGYRDDLDWYDQVIHNGYRGEYLLSGSGASDKSDYYFSLGYLDENGYVKNNNFSRISGRTAINLRPTKWLKTGFTLNATSQKTRNANGAGADETAYTNAFNYCRNIAPVYPVHLHYTNDGINDDRNGEYILDGAGNKQWDPGYYNIKNEDGTEAQIQTRNQYVGRHMLWENEVKKKVNKRETINGTAYADFTLPFNIIASVKANLNIRKNRQDTYDSSIIGDGAANNGRMTFTANDYRSYTLQEQLRWGKTFNGKHNVDVLLGHENYDYKRTYNKSAKSNEILLGGSFADNFTSLTDISGYSDRYKTESYLGRVQYNYDERYNIEASFRRDGSSRFAKDNRWGNFGSVGANWIFTNEDFMKEFTWLNSGKLRADWGRVANDAAADYYGYMSLLALDKYGGEGAFIVTQKAATDLSWETGESWGIALETRLFNRWNFSIEYYNKINKDLIFAVNDPASAGSTSNGSYSATHNVNFGSIANRGFEINTDFDIIANKDWTVNIAANVTTLKNEVTELPEIYKEEGYRSGNYLINEGKSRYEWNTYTYCGVDMTNGNALYAPNFDSYFIKDGNNIVGNPDGTELKAANYAKIGDKYYVYNPSSYGSRTYKGSALPSVYGSFTGNFRYKNFSLSAMFTYSLGGKVMDGVYNSLMNFSGNPVQMHADALNSWTPDMIVAADAPNRINTSINPQIHQEEYTTNNATSDRWLTSRDYLVFKNLNCAYKIPRSLLKKIDLQAATVSFSCENLFTVTARKGMDSQQSLNGSQDNYLTTPRVFTFGLSLNI